MNPVRDEIFWDLIDLAHVKVLVCRLLVAAIALELAGLCFWWRRHSRPGPLPQVDWSVCMIEGTVADEIREMEKHLQPGNPAGWSELAAAYRAFGLFPQAEYCYRQVDKRWWR